MQHWLVESGLPAVRQPSVVCGLAAASPSHCQGKPEKTDLNIHLSHTDCHRVGFENRAIRFQVWRQTDPIPLIRAVWSHKQKPLAKLNAWLRPAHQMFWLVNKLLVHYFKCNVLLLLYKNSSAEIFRTGKRQMWTKVTSQWSGLYSWGVLWRSWERTGTPPSLDPTKRRGKGLRGCLVPVGRFSQNNSKYVALSCFSVFSTGCHRSLFCSLMELYWNCFTDIKLNFQLWNVITLFFLTMYLLQPRLSVSVFTSSE